MIDIHCHILPCVDDGAQDIPMSLRMLDAAARGGVRTLFATPHLFSADQDLTEIRQRFDWLEPLAQARGIALRLGYEIHYLALPDMRDFSPFLMGGTNALLIELPFDLPFPNWIDYLKRLAKRHLPIIAHPERYHYIQKNLALAGTLREIGCELQLSADAFFLSPLNPVRRTAQALFQENLASYIASDAHTDAKYLQALRAMTSREQKWEAAALRP